MWLVSPNKQCLQIYIRVAQLVRELWYQSLMQLWCRNDHALIPGSIDTEGL